MNYLTVLIHNQTVLGAFLGAILSTFFSILFIFWLEKIQQPVLSIRIEPVPPDLRYADGRPASRHRALRVIVANERITGLLRHFLTRRLALNCRGVITFHHINDGQDVFGRAMEGRWAGSPQPVPLRGVIRGEQFLIIDDARLTLESRINIFADEQAELDIAARFDEDIEAYGWNNEAYFSNPMWRNPTWRLPPNRYLVRISIVAANATANATYRLINDVPMQDFRLLSITRADERLFRT